MSKVLIMHIQYTDGSYEVEEVEVTNTTRIEEIKIHNKEVRKYIYETKKITSKYSVEEIQQMTGQEFGDDSLDPLEKLIEAEEGNFYDSKDMVFEKGLVLLGQALDTLTEKQKEVFASVHLLGKTKREIAANKKVSHTAINDCYDGALKRLRKFFAQYPEFLTYFPGLKNR